MRCGSPPKVLSHYPARCDAVQSRRHREVSRLTRSRTGTANSPPTSNPIMAQRSLTHRLIPAALLAVAMTSCGGLTDGAAAEVASVTCTSDDTAVDTDVVRAQRDGIHLRIDNQATADRIVHVRHRDDFRNFRVPPGSSTVIATHGPGSWEIVCAGPDGYPGETAAWESLRVSDPDGLWVAHELACDHPTSLHPDYQEYFEGRLPEGTKGDPLAIATAEVPHWYGSQPGDEVRVAGYPDSSPRLFQAVRGDDTVAVADYRDDGRGGWFFGSVSYCEDQA